MKRSLSLLLVCLIALFITACGGETSPGGPAQIDPPFPPPGPLGTTPHVYPVETGWFDGKAVKYYNFGTNTPLDPQDPSRVAVEGVWVLTTGLNPDGSPIRLEGQHNLFTVIPGDPGYSDLWQPTFVYPPADYQPNSIRSVDELLARGMPMEKQPLLVNCPFVPIGSELADKALPIVKGWVRGQLVEYFDFGPTSAKPGKLYAFVTGFDANGNPQLVPGQHVVFDTSRESQNYSDFWRVHWVKVDSSYRADSIRSAGDVPQNQVIVSTIVVNYPHKQQ